MPMSCNLMFFNNYSGRFVRNFYYIILAIATILVSCEIRIKPNEDTNGADQVCSAMTGCRADTSRRATSLRSSR